MITVIYVSRPNATPWSVQAARSLACLELRQLSAVRSDASPATLARLKATDHDNGIERGFESPPRPAVGDLQRPRPSFEGQTTDIDDLDKSGPGV
ncbi:MAG: hypothetical protein ACRECL_11090 [Bradyrhizobium sp.]